MSVLSTITARAADPATGKKSYTLKGTITDAGGHPLADVRVGLKVARAQVQTDAKGQFTLPFSREEPMAVDKNKNYDFFELDHDGYLGRTIDIKDLSFFDQPVAEKLEPNPVTADRAEFTKRMSVDYYLPPTWPGMGKFNRETCPDISAAEWGTFFSSMPARKKTEDTDRASFQAYIPKNATKLKAMLLLSRHGMGTIDHPTLRAFADRNAVALVGLNGNPIQRGFYPVTIIDDDIKKLGQLLHHPELSTLPLISFGHSNGSGFSCIFPSQCPNRVIAWISYHSGNSFPLQFPGIEKVPGLAMHGSIDPFAKNNQEETVKNLRTNRNAAVAMMMEGNVGHAPVERDHIATWEFIAQFCEAAMRIRLKSDGTLQPVAIEKGWLGANYDQSQGGRQELAIAPYAEFTGDRSVANWLPDKKFAEVWQLYGKTAPQNTK